MKVHDTLMVVRDFLSPLDPTGKRRFAVVLALHCGKAVVAPCTTFPERKGYVPSGCVLITRASNIFKEAGFTADKIAVNLRDAARFSSLSKYFKDCKEVGLLHLFKDNSLRGQFNTILAGYDIAEMPLYDKDD